MTEPSGPNRTSADLLRFIVLFSALYVAFGVASPFLPAFLLSRGIAPEQLGFLLSLSIIVRLGSGPIAGRIADRLHALRRVLTICTAGAAVLASCFVPISGFLPLLVTSLLHAALLAPTTTLADALALRSATQNGNPRFEYGWVRGTGSAAFIAGTIASGQAVNVLGLGSALAAQAIFLASAACAASLVPEIPMRRREGRGHSYEAAIPGLSTLLFNRAFRRLVLVAALVLGSHAMHDAFAMIVWNAAGISPAIGSILWSASVAAEILVFFVVGPWLLQRNTPIKAMIIAALAAMLRWIVMSQGPSVLILALVQPLHGLTFALLHLACMRILVVVTPIELAATAQAVYAFGIGASAAMVTLASGFLYARVGPAGFLVMAALALASLPAIWALSRSLSRVNEDRP
jgi:MFS transporter, PPP family, 3-phenylpropionic acid transporter